MLQPMILFCCPEKTAVCGTGMSPIHQGFFLYPLEHSLVCLFVWKEALLWTVAGQILFNPDLGGWSKFREEWDIGGEPERTRRDILWR